MPARIILQERSGLIQLSFQAEGRPVEQAGPEEAFQFSLDFQEREDLRWYLEEYLAVPYAVYEERGEAVEQKIPQWGERLFTAVFQNGLRRAAYERALAQGPADLWIASSSPQFLSLPWEILRDPDRSSPLAFELAGINRQVGIFSEPVLERRPDPTLRILLVIARPYREDVQYWMIARPLLDRLAPVARDIELEVLRPATREALRERLLAAHAAGQPFQVVHFDGHGTFQAGFGGIPEPQGYVVFEKEAGGQDLVSARALAELLAESAIPLLVFNSCRSARLDVAAGLEASIATGVLQSGPVAVVAMGFLVYARAAVEFLAAFYASLFTGRTVAQSVTEGRRRMSSEPLRPSPRGPLPLSDWLVPVHYASHDLAFPELRPLSQPLGTFLEGLLVRAGDGSQTPPDPLLAAEQGLFFGRDREILALERALRARRVAVLHGLGGVGKTELAKGYARWLAASGGLDRQDGVFFHSFEPGTASFRLANALFPIGVRLFGMRFAALSPAERRERVLRALRESRLLLIWDNFESVQSLHDPEKPTPPLTGEEGDDLRSFLEEVAGTGRAQIVVTSRSREEWLGTGPVRIEVGGLDGEAVYEYAEALLAPFARARERRRERAYETLLRHLAGHPLSLRLILPRLEEEHPASLLAALSGERELREEAAAGRHATLENCIDYSLRHIEEELQRRLPALALFDGVADLHILERLSTLEGTPEAFRGLSRSDWEATLDRAVGVGLLGRLNPSLFRIHPALPRALAALWHRKATGAFEAQWRSALRASVRAHAERAERLFLELESHVPQPARNALQHEHRNFAVAAALALDFGAYTEALWILEMLILFWTALGQLEEGRSWITLCRSEVETEPGVPPPLLSPEGRLWLFMVVTGLEWDLDAGRLDEAAAQSDRLLQALESAGTEEAAKPLAGAYLVLGKVELYREDLTAAQRHYRRALESFEGLQAWGSAALCCHQLGIVAQKLRQWDEAEILYHRALESFDFKADFIHVAKVLHQRGLLAQARWDLTGASISFHSSLRVEESLGNKAGMGKSYYHLGQLAEIRGDFEGAERWLRKALEVFENLGDPLELSHCYHQIGLVVEMRGAQAEAEAWFRRSIELKDKHGDAPGLANSYHQLGCLAHRFGDRSEASIWYGRSLALSEQLGDRLGVAGCHQQLGVLALDSKQYEEAARYLQAAIRELEALAEWHPLAAAYCQMGRLARERSRLEEAEAWYLQALRIYEELGDQAGLASVCHGLGWVENLRGDLEASEASNRKALEIWTSLHDLQRLPHAFFLEAVTALKRMDFAAAEAAFYRALEIAEPLGEKPHLAPNYLALGLFALREDDPQRALEWMVRAVCLFEEFPSPLTGTAPQRMAELTAELGWPALEVSWERWSGGPLPEEVRTWVKEQINRQGRWSRIVRSVSDSVAGFWRRLFQPEPRIPS